MQLKMKLGLIISLISLSMIIGCNSNHEGMDMGNDYPMTPIEVELSIQPEQIKVNENVIIEVQVTQNKEMVTDADKVLIEIIPSEANGTHVELEASHISDGLYVLETSLDQADTYSVISHVTVGAMHSMPKTNLIVTE
ncbi:FixH family protein [Paenibacillus crassostreae]|uniref:YtkA-like domain-containing protein n=1 Tax=Paenibacillus crassostreae TaxID=1763538 RepID=A0A167DS68_9BACL|nr:FixH family protein [Paenibacillus crassostreae]AOZ91120.1 hypothetical protein LPB68_02130 [Paenibacillus crassostreae]OAB74720.1 hypothetical protein PNBC_11825 [Paenibacillus crassostreae]